MGVRCVSESEGVLPSLAGAIGAEGLPDEGDMANASGFDG